MKSLMLLWKMLAYESASWCCTSATMDWKTVQGRCEHEGLPFLTITLPSFGKDLQKGLERGSVDHDLFHGFSWKGGLPKFLWGFLDLVFDRASGRLLDEPSTDSIRAIQQLTLLFAKIELPCTPERERQAFDDFVQCEKDVRVSDAQLTIEMESSFKRISTMLFWDVLPRLDRKIWDQEIHPMHGPGSVADSLTSNGKWNQRTWPRRIDSVFPITEHLIANYSFRDELDSVDILEPGSEIPSKVISVPKTQKTPRIIAKEPTAMQYMQQGLRRDLYDLISRVDFLEQMIGFTDQTPNQRLAREGSLSGDLATLDLSEASDRVSNQHVRLLTRNYSDLSAAIDATRSRKADVPGHGVIRLAKFAPMGSALCFPMEAMVFLTIVFHGIERTLKRPLSYKDIQSLKDSVRVYGDDIIVPVEYVHSVVRSLHAFGYVVNEHKSFWNGKFRESCGMEYYAGDDVSYVKVRQMFPLQRRHATEVISTVSLRNQLYFRGYWKTVRWLDKYILGVIRHFPYVLPTSPVLGRHSVLGYETQRIDEHLQSPLVRGFVVSSRSPIDRLDGHAALHKWFSTRGEFPHIDENHLERAGRPRVVSIKPGWNPSV